MKLADRFYDDTISRACQDKIWDGIDLDRKHFNKTNGRLIDKLRRKKFGPALADLMVKGSPQPGLYWAQGKDLLPRCLEQIVIDHPDDFPAAVRDSAEKRLAVLQQPPAAKPVEDQED